MLSEMETFGGFGGLGENFSQIIAVLNLKLLSPKTFGCCSLLARIACLIILSSELVVSSLPTEGIVCSEVFLLV